MNLFARLKSWAKRVRRDAITLWFASKHAQTPWYAKAMGLFVVAYALSPIDARRQPMRYRSDDSSLTPHHCAINSAMVLVMRRTDSRCTRSSNPCMSSDLGP